MDAFVSTTLERLQATSVQTALLAMAVWALCRFVPRLAPSTQCWLWWLVAFQALLGLVVSPIRLAWLPPGPGEPAGILLPLLTDAVRTQNAAPDPATLAINWQLTTFLIWLAGFLIASAMAMRHWQGARALRRSSMACTDEAVLESLARTASASGLPKAPALRFSEQIESPMLLGNIRPLLLLPARTRLGPQDLEMALMHELAHLRRRDLWWGCAPFLARALFFFHPLVHLAVREYSLAREAACDAAVVDSNRCSREDYGRLLLRFGTSIHTPSCNAMASPTYLALSKRLTLLQEKPLMSRTGSFVLVVLVAVVGILPLRLVESASAAEAVAQTPRTEAPQPAQEQPPQAAPVPPPATPARTAPSPASPGEESRVTFSVQDMPVRMVVGLIAEAAARNIVVHESVGGTLTLKFDDLPWDVALDLILRSRNLRRIERDDTILVVPADSISTVNQAAGAESNEANRQFLELQKQQLESRLQEIERRQRGFTARSIPEPMQDAEEPEAGFAAARRDYERLRAQHEELRRRWEELAARHPDLAIQQTPESEQNVEQLQLSRARLAQLLLKYREQHPEVVAERRLLSELERSIAEQ